MHNVVLGRGRRLGASIAHRRKFYIAIDGGSSNRRLGGGLYRRRRGGSHVGTRGGGRLAGGLGIAHGMVKPCDHDSGCRTERESGRGRVGGGSGSSDRSGTNPVCCRWVHRSGRVRVDGTAGIVVRYLKTSGVGFVGCRCYRRFMIQEKEKKKKQISTRYYKEYKQMQDRGGKRYKTEKG